MKNHLFKTLLLLTLALSALATPGRAAVLYVDVTNGFPSGELDNPAAPWNSIAGALAELSLFYMNNEPSLTNVIRIAPGVYHEDNGAGGLETYPIVLHKDLIPTNSADTTLIGWSGGANGRAAAAGQVVVEVRRDIPVPGDTIVVASRGVVRVMNMTFRGPGKGAAPAKTSRAFDLGPPVPSEPVWAFFEDVVIEQNSLDGILLKSSAVIKRFRNVTVQDNGLYGLTTDVGLQIEAFENSRILRNGKSGLYIRGDLTGDLKDCVISQNGEHGLLVEGSWRGHHAGSRCSVEGSLFHSNAWCGVSLTNTQPVATFQANLTGHISQCAFIQNGQFGLQIRGDLTGDVDDATFFNNGQHGLRAGRNVALGHIARSSFQGNARSGLHLEGTNVSVELIQDSVFSQNLGAGLLTSNALVVGNGFRRNAFYQNGAGGVVVGGTLAGDFVDNTFLNNNNTSGRTLALLSTNAFQAFDPQAALGYRTNQDGRLEWWSLENPANPVKMGEFRTNGTLRAYAPDGWNQRFILLTADSNGVWFHVLATTDPAAPVVAASAQIRPPGETNEVKKLLVNELQNLSYVFFRDGRMLKITNSTGAVLGQFSYGADQGNNWVAAEADFERQTLYVLSRAENRLRFVDAVQDADIRVRWETSTREPIALLADSKRQKVFLIDRALEYDPGVGYSRNARHLNVFDAYNPAAPSTLVDTRYWEDDLDLRHYDGAARQLIGQKGTGTLVIWDVANPASPARQDWSNAQGLQGTYDPNSQRIVGNNVWAFTEVSTAVQAPLLQGRFENNLFRETRTNAWPGLPVLRFLVATNAPLEFHHNVFWGNRRDLAMLKGPGRATAHLANNIFGASAPVAGSTALFEGVNDLDFFLHNNVFFNREVFLYNGGYGFSEDNADFYYSQTNELNNKFQDPELANPGVGSFRPTNATAFVVNKGRLDCTAQGCWTLPLVDRAGSNRPSAATFHPPNAPDIGLFEFVPAPNAPPQIAPLPDLLVGTNQGLVVIPLEVRDETLPAILEVQVLSTNQTLVRSNGLFLIGSGYSRLLAVVLQPGAGGQTALQILVRDEAGLSNSLSFALRRSALLPQAELFWHSLPLANGMDPLELGVIVPGESRTFTLRNTGSTNLDTLGLSVEAPFLLSEGLAASIPAGGFDSFTVTRLAGTNEAGRSVLRFRTSDSAHNEFLLPLLLAAPSNAPNVQILGPPEGYDLSDSPTLTIPALANDPQGHLAEFWWALDYAMAAETAWLRLASRTNSLEPASPIQWPHQHQLAAGSYALRLSAGNGSATNRAYRLLTNSLLSLVPMDPFPAVGTLEVATDLVLRWSTRYPAENYAVYLWPASQAPPVSPTALVGPAHEDRPVGGLEAAQTYRWQVVASNGGAWIASPLWSFSTLGYPVAEILAPTDGPVGAFPMLTITGSAFSSLSSDFSWILDSAAGQNPALGWSPIRTGTTPVLNGVLADQLRPPLPGTNTLRLRVSVGGITATNLRILTFAEPRAVLVDQRNTSGLENGLTWATAFTNLQAGVNTAAPFTGQVWVAEGLFRERVSCSNVTVRGGFAGHELLAGSRQLGLHETIIDAENRGAPILVANRAALEALTLRGATNTLGGPGATLDSCQIQFNSGNPLLSASHLTNCSVGPNVPPSSTPWRLAATSPLLSHCTVVGPYVFQPPTVGAWQLVSHVPALSARHWFAMAYDEGRDRTVVFGGYTSNNGFLDETWEFDGFTWTQVCPIEKPSARRCVATTYDARRRKLVLFGGYGASGKLDDTWEYDGTTWTSVATSVRPPGRYEHALAFDCRRGKVVMFGGFGGGTDTWEYDGFSWTNIVTADKPSARYDHGMTFDPQRHRVVLFGGNDGAYLNDTWEYDGTGWARKSPAQSPPVRAPWAATYDRARGTVVVFGGLAGGTSYLDDTWEFNGNSWQEIKLQPRPPARGLHGLAFDARRRSLVVFGGYRPDNTATNDTWLLRLAESQNSVLGGLVTNGPGVAGCLFPNGAILAGTLLADSFNRASWSASNNWRQINPSSGEFSIVTNRLRLSDNNNAEEPWLWHSFATNARVWVSVTMTLASGGTNPEPFVRITGGGRSLAAVRCVTNRLYYGSGGAWINIGLAVPRDQPVPLQFEVDCSRGVFSLVVSNTLVCSRLPCYETNPVADALELGAAGYNQSGVVYWDDVLVDVPNTGNLIADPLFRNAPAGDFRLRPGSPALDAGVDSAGVAADLGGNPRPFGAGYDIGCHEFSLAAPRFLAQPWSVVTDAGDDASFTVTVSGTAPISYQWSHNGTNLEGGTSATLLLAKVQPAQEGGYSVVVSNDFGSVTSLVATLTVRVPLAITRQPESLVAGIGGVADFDVTAVGTPPLFYQWRFENQPLADQTNPVLRLSNLKTDDSGGYSVVVSNAAGWVTSAVATLIVAPPPPTIELSYPNPNPIQIRDEAPAWPYPSTISLSNVVGTVTKVTVTFSNLAHPYPADLDCLLVGPQGQKVMLMSDAGSDSAPIRFLTFDDAAPDLLPRYEPLASGTYQPTDYEPANLPAPAPAGPYPLSLASMNVTNGNGVWSLYIADHFAGEVGPLGGWSVNLSVTADVRDVPRLVAQPVSLVATQGLPTVLSAQATGARPLRFQWLFHGGPLEGATADSLTLPEVTPAQAGGYSLVVSNLFGVVTSQVAVLTVLVPPTLGFSPVSRSVVAGRMISWAVTAVGSPPLQYQWVFNGTNLANGPRITGADQAVLTISNVQKADASWYRVQVANAAGEVTSAPPAFLTVYPAEVVSSAWQTNGRFQLNLQGQTGSRFEIQASTTLTNWRGIGLVTNWDGLFLFQDANATNYPRRFYRAMEKP